MKKKYILIIGYILSFIPMLFNQYGWGYGICEIKGIINITNPIGILSIISFFIGVLEMTKSNKANKLLVYFGTIGIVISELYNLFTWNYPNTSILNHILDFTHMVFPAYYIGIVSSILMVIFSFYYNEKK